MNKIFRNLMFLVLGLSLATPAFAADFRSRQRVQIHDGTDEFAVTSAKPIFSQLSDGTDVATVNASGQLDVAVGNTVTVTATDLDIRNLSETTDQVLIFANTAANGTGTDLVPLVDASGHLQVDILSGATGGTEYNEDDATPATIVGKATLMERDDVLSTLTPVEGDWNALRSNARGALWVELDPTNDVDIADGGNVISVDDAGSTISIDDGGGDISIDWAGTAPPIGAGTEAAALRVTVATDSTGVLSVDDNGGSITVDATQLDIDDLSASADNVAISDGTDTLAVNTDGSINVVVDDDATSSSEVHNYNTVAAVAKDATSNHDYTVANTTFLLKSVIVAASGALKAEIQTGPVASLATVAVLFTSGSGDTKQVTFDPPIEVPVTSTGTVRVIRRNDDNSAMDVYSTIIGNDI